MGIKIKTPGVHHVTLRTADFRRARQFYARDTGVPNALEQPDLLIILAGSTAVGIRAPAKGTPKGDKFDPLRVGSRSPCYRLPRGGRTRSGCQGPDASRDREHRSEEGRDSGKRYVAFKDPDRIAWELYMAYGV